jgi:hypothetical protein
MLMLAYVNVHLTLPLRVYSRQHATSQKVTGCTGEAWASVRSFLGHLDQSLSADYK